jgi:hypothetical protein
MPRFAFLKVDPIHDPQGRLYLWRLRILETPWFGVFLHAIHQPDSDRELHDHPWPFVSFVLRGEYVEEIPAAVASSQLDRVADLLAAGRLGTTTRVVRWFRRMRLLELHRIVELRRPRAEFVDDPPRPVWTLVFIGRKSSRWGFATRQGWREHDKVLAERQAAELARPRWPS